HPGILLPSKYAALLRLRFRPGLREQTASWLRCKLGTFVQNRYYSLIDTAAILKKITYRRELPMKDLYEVLRQKENEFKRLGKEIEALRLTAAMLAEQKGEAVAVESAKAV